MTYAMAPRQHIIGALKACMWFAMKVILEVKISPRCCGFHQCRRRLAERSLQSATWALISRIVQYETSATWVIDKLNPAG